MAGHWRGRGRAGGEARRATSDSRHVNIAPAFSIKLARVRVVSRVAPIACRARISDIGMEASKRRIIASAAHRSPLKSRSCLCRGERLAYLRRAAPGARALPW